MSERSSVQNPMLKYAAEIGWEYIPPDQTLALRQGETGRFLLPVLEEQLLRLNAGIVDTGRAAEIIRLLNLLRPTIEGNRDALEWMRGEQSVFVPEENRQRNVRLIDFENPARNKFNVTDEWRHKSAVLANRADVVFIINGITVAVCETKAAEKPDALAIGIDQIRRYHRETPEMLVAPQVFEVTELLNFFYAPTWSTNRKNLFNWKEESPGDYESKVKHFFDHARFLQVLRDYIVFMTKDDQLSKIILRQHQTRAVEKVIDRVYDTRKQRGLVWHTQGSGKTLTMITIAAQLLRETRDGEKPTVLMLVDRNELEQQLFKNLTAYGISNVEVAQSKDDLRRLFAHDTRGLIVSMIHKFDRADENLNPRQSVIVLVDEAHRTTGGHLGNYLMGALPNATYIGFTGTPIDRISKGQGTFKIFGGEDERGYLDKYSIAESIQDGTTVQLNYALAPSDLRVQREILEKEFLSLADSEGVTDVEELNAILDKAVELKEMMKAPTRVDMIARYVAEHYRQNVEPLGFKAFLVGVDREACVLYKKALDKYLPSEYSLPIYSPAHNDAPNLKEYYLTEDQEKQVRRSFLGKSTLKRQVVLSSAALEFIRSRPDDFAYDESSGALTVLGNFTAQDRTHVEGLLADPNAIAQIRELYDEYQKRLPKILIVTEKLLTGFDAPILYCMYLDKPMRDHVLLQAIARVNRPYEDDDGLVKPYGFVLDFVGIFEKLEKALAFDSDDVTAVIQNIDVLKDLFKKLMRETAPQYLPLARGWDDKAKERAIQHFGDKAKREEFYKFFRQIESLYEILSPDAELRPFIKEYEALAELFALIRNAYSTRPYTDKELTEKTRQLLRSQTTSSNLEPPGAIHELGAQELAALKDDEISDSTKILNLSRAIAQAVNLESGAKPYLVPIGERAEVLREAWESRQKTTQEALKEFEGLAQEHVDAETTRQHMGLDENAYAIFKTLPPLDGTVTAQTAQELNSIFEQFPDYDWNDAQKSQLRTKLYKTLRPLVGAQFIQAANSLLKLKRV